MGGQYTSPTRNLLVRILVACEQGLHRHLEPICSNQKLSFLEIKRRESVSPFRCIDPSSTFGHKLRTGRIGRSLECLRCFSLPIYRVRHP